MIYSNLFIYGITVSVILLLFAIWKDKQPKKFKL
jgi:hypothetical protein